MIRIFSHALIFGLAPLLQKAVGVVLLPLYTHHLTTRDYGEIELLSITTGLFGLVLRLELRAGYMRAWLAAASNGERAALLSGSAALLVLLGAFGGGLFWAASGTLTDVLLGYRIGSGYAALLAAGILVDVLSLAFHATLQAQLHSRLMVSLGVAQFIVGASLTVVFVVYMGSGPIGFFIGGVVASALALAVMAGVCFRRFGFSRPSWSEVRGLVKYSLPLLVAALLFFVVRNADRYAVSHFLSVSDLGIYALAWTLVNLLLTMVFSPIQTSLDVWRYKLHAADDARQFADVFRVAMVIICLAAVGLNTFGVDIFRLVIAEDFAPAVIYAPLLSAAVILQSGYAIVASAFYVTGATGQWSKLFAAGATLQVGLSIALVPVFGIFGAAFGIVAANLLLYVAAARWGRRLWAVPYAHGRVVAAIALATALSYGRTLVPTPDLVTSGAIDAAVLVLFALLLFPLRLVTRQDIAGFGRLVADGIEIIKGTQATR